jgi:hypothetical protein
MMLSLPAQGSGRIGTFRLESSIIRSESLNIDFEYINPRPITRKSRAAVA